jgi:putative flippase GtrA
MNTFRRWAKFNLVGAMGTALQLGVLALWTSSHYLYASAAAVELALLHNFTWHWHYTWRDRRPALLRAFVRFHLANGLVSLMGNVAVMWLLVEKAHWPVLASNAAAILCCSVANFFLSDNWAFNYTTMTIPSTSAPVQ